MDDFVTVICVSVVLGIAARRSRSCRTGSCQYLPYMSILMKSHTKLSSLRSSEAGEHIPCLFDEADEVVCPLVISV